MAGAVNLTPGDGPSSFLLNFNDAGKYISLSGSNEDQDNSVQCTVIGCDANGQSDPDNLTFVMSLAPLQTDTLVFPVNKQFPVVINARGKQSGFDVQMS